MSTRTPTTRPRHAPRFHDAFAYPAPSAAVSAIRLQGWHRDRFSPKRFAANVAMTEFGVRPPTYGNVSAAELQGAYVYAGTARIPTEGEIERYLDADARFIREKSGKRFRWRRAHDPQGTLPMSDERRAR